jgi:hypothetical protein
VGWGMQFDTGGLYAVVHATCDTGEVSVRKVKFVDSADGDPHEAADAMAEALDINPKELYVIPAGSLTQPAKRGGHTKG